MENCLVTRLKGIVDNDNLVKYGHINLAVNGDGSYSDGRLRIGWTTDTQCSVKSSNSTYDWSGVGTGGEYDFNVNVPDVGKTAFDASDKYQIMIIGGRRLSFDFEDMKYSPLSVIDCASFADEAQGQSIETLLYSATDIKRLTINNCYMTGNIENIATKISSNYYYDEINLSYNNFTGDLACLLNIPSSITSINIYGTNISFSQETLDAFTAKGVTIMHN